MPETAPSIKPTLTAAGIAVYWGAIGLVLVGGVRFSGVTLLIGVFALILLGAARILCRKNLEDLVFFRELPRSAFAGELFEASRMVAKDGGSNAIPRELEFRDFLLQGSHFTPFSKTLPARISRRGKHSRDGYEVKSSWPFGLFTSACIGTYEPNPDGVGDQILIFPRPLMPSALLRQLETIQAELLASNHAEIENAGEFRGLRPYRPGDAVKSIHWPATARANELVVRDWDPPRPKPRKFGIILHSLAAPGQLKTPHRFETAVRITTGLLIYCRQNAIPVWLSTDVSSENWFKIPEETGYTAALIDLALSKMEPGRSSDSLKTRVQKFQPCERLFVVSDSPVEYWHHLIAGRHPNLIFSDPDSVATAMKRQTRIKTAQSTNLN